ncbi:translocation/assembly module TamB domain-containing protein [Shewanella mesophila]|uniref:autotransporter assembly complex protein TamB n=1 Tax=Shewanella mesophila TaxID=2864208 RepID=UPI001C6597C7|nr:translocation/assembly module TamB domain-containing protein [Shewanella mesophila]QYJ84681.1 translocation/assembly module TamB domain-containing protein [Shewanella mesophila]
MSLDPAPEQIDNKQVEPFTRSPLNRVFRWIRHTLRVVIYLPLLLLIIAAILIGTPFGSRIAVNLADLLVPNLEVSYGSGTLNQQLALSHAHWQMSGIDIDAEALLLNWRPLCLLQQQLCVNALNASKVVVNIDTELIGPSIEHNELTTSGKNSSDLVGTEKRGKDIDQFIPSDHQLTLPIGIILTETQLENVSVRVNDMQFNADSLKGQASWLETGLRVNTLSSDGLFASIPLNSRQGATEVEAASDEEWPLAHLPQVLMPMPIFVDNAELTNSQLLLGSRLDKFEHISLQGSYTLYDIVVEHLAIKHDYGQLQLDGKLTLNHDYPMKLNLESTLVKVPELPLLKQQQIEAYIEGSFEKLNVTSKGQGHINYQLASSIDLTQASLPYSLHLTSDHIMWPLTAPQYEAKALTLNTTGSLEEQQASFTGKLLTPYHPELQIETELTHNKQQIDIRQLDVDSDMGKLRLTGQLGYGEQISWNAAIDTEKLELQYVTLNNESTLPDTQITGHIKTQGNIGKEHWQIAVSDADLNGAIDDYPLRLQGDLQVNEKYHLNAKNLVIDALESQLSISGRVDEQWTLTGELSVPALSLWDPRASGAIAATVHVSGENEHPEISLSGETIEFNFAEVSVEKARLKGFYRPLDKHQFALSLKSSEIKRDTISLSSFTLGLKGDQEKQKLGLQTFGDIRLDTSIASTFDIDTEQLDLNIKRLSLNSMMGLVELDKPINLKWDNKQQQGDVSPFCWQHQHGALCLEDNVTLANAGNAAVTFSGDIGALLDPILPDQLNWQGPATLNSKFSWAAPQKPKALIELIMPKGQLSLQTNKRKIDASYRHLSIKASLDEALLAINTQFESEKFANIDSHIEIGVIPGNPLSGNIKLSKINLLSLSDFTPQLETLDGIISSDLTLSGTLQKPELLGNIILKQGKLLAAANPTLLDNIDLNIDLKGQDADLNASWNMGDGNADLLGNIDWNDGNLRGNITFNGDKLAFIQPPMIILDVSPALNVQFGNNSLNIDGQIDVPSGHVHIVQLPEGGIAESSDVIFNDSLASKQQVNDPLAITSKIKIHVGDKLSIDGMGLKGRLKGTLDLRQEAYKPPSLYGDIKVVNGNYKFMGQTLAIKMGEVQFIGPLAVPNLNIEAIREIKEDDVTAGVRVTGTPLRPIVTLFSTPAKEQAEILSYIVKGTGINNNSDSQNSALMMGAALTIGNQLGGGTVNSIGNQATGVIEKFGLSNVQLDTNDDGKVAISGFIGENLMVKYGIGVFSPGYEMTVRYYLMSQLYLESVSGSIEKSLDIYYNFNID